MDNSKFCWCSISMLGDSEYIFSLVLFRFPPAVVYSRMPSVLTSTQSESLNTLLHVWHHFTDNGQFLWSFWCTRKYSFETCRSGFRGSLWSKLSTTDQVEVSPSDSSWLTLLNFIGVTCEVVGGRVAARSIKISASPFSILLFGRSFFQTCRENLSGNNDFQSDETLKTYLRAFGAYPGSTDSILRAQRKNFDSPLLIDNAPCPLML